MTLKTNSGFSLGQFKLKQFVLIVFDIFRISAGEICCQKNRLVSMSIANKTVSRFLPSFVHNRNFVCFLKSINVLLLKIKREYAFTFEKF